MIDIIERLKLPVNVVGVIASAENMINEKSMKPDDVLRHSAAKLLKC